jgi:hypothetical protein
MRYYKIQRINSYSIGSTRTGIIPDELLIGPR